MSTDCRSKSLRKIERLAKDYYFERQLIATRIRLMEEEIAAVRRRYEPHLRKQLGRAANVRSRLEVAIDGARHLFKRPRTLVMHGLRIGLQKGKGELRWRSNSAVVSLIRKHFPDQFDTLVKVTEKPLKTPLGQLSAAELKRIGVEVAEAGDQVVIKPTDAQVDKLIEAIVKQLSETEEES